MIWYNEDFLHLACSTPQHHSWALVFCTAGISRSCGKADLNWLLRELRHTRHRDTAVKLWHTFASSTLLRCRHARCAHEMRLARQLELTLSIHHLQNDHCLKGLQSGFRSISWIFHVISTIQGKHTCHMCIPGRRFGSAWSGWPFLVTEKSNGNSTGRAFAELERGRSDFFVSRGVFLFFPQELGRAEVALCRAWSFTCWLQ